MEECIFCRIAKGEILSMKIYEDDLVFAFLDIKPITQGHVLVIPKKHSENIEDINLDDLAACTKALKKLGPIVMKAVEADGFNIGNNNQSAAGQVVMHTHFHIIPRYKNDGLSGWPNQNTTKEELQKIHSKIVKYINK